MPTKKSWYVLYRVNHHPRDDRVEFQEEGHKYKIDGSVDGWISATSLLSGLHHPFDSSKAADALMKGKRYKSGEHPLAGKSKEDIIAHWGSENKRGTALHARMELGMQGVHLGYGPTGSPGGGASAGHLKRVTGTFAKESAEGISDDKHRIRLCEMTKEVFILYPLTTEDDSDTRRMLHLGFLWDDGTVRRNRPDEAELGEEEPVLYWNEAVVEALQVREFWETHAVPNHLVPHRSEWVIWDDTYKIAGTIDALMRNTETGGYWIYDWKRVSKGLEVDIEATRYGYRPEPDEWLGEVSRWTKRMLAPAEDLYDTKYWHYSLQLNLYRSILERCYGMRIEGMVLVQMHPSIAGVRCHRVVRLEDPIRRVLEKRAEELATEVTES
jgi:hypothetical protein